MALAEWRRVRRPWRQVVFNVPAPDGITSSGCYAKLRLEGIKLDDRR
ncbi:MAG: hypothetical protein JO296_16265 [Pseudonocardiales bacterium]|nr:hypothetical protein [Pseudonocardiales bacterium]